MIVRVIYTKRNYPNNVYLRISFISFFINRLFTIETLLSRFLEKRISIFIDTSTTLINDNTTSESMNWTSKKILRGWDLNSDPWVVKGFCLFPDLSILLQVNTQNVNFSNNLLRILIIPLKIKWLIQCRHAFYTKNAKKNVYKRLFLCVCIIGIIQRNE